MSPKVQGELSHDERCPKADVLACSRSHCNERTGGKGASSSHLQEGEEPEKGPSPNWKDAVRATIYHHSSDSKAYTEGLPDFFVKAGQGIWGLRHPKEEAYNWTPSGLQAKALNEITIDEFRSVAGDLAGIKRLIENKIDAIRKRVR